MLRTLRPQWIRYSTPVIMTLSAIGNSNEVWTALNALATFMAVAVALFSPFAMEYLRRPQLQVFEAHQLSARLAHAGSSTEGLLLFVDITNRGRRQANDVQVFLSMGTMTEIPGHDRPAHRVVAFQTPIAFQHQEGGVQRHQHSVAIPEGFARPLQLLTSFRKGATLANAGDQRKPVLQDGEYQVTLDLVGSNFKVVRYEGQLKITSVDSPDPRDRLVAEWAQLLKKVRYAPGNPLEAWANSQQT